jgi:hypothetical protein
MTLALPMQRVLNTMELLTRMQRLKNDLTHALAN